MLVFEKIASGCSVNFRKSAPVLELRLTGTIHQSDAARAHPPARQAKLHTSRSRRSQIAAWYASSRTGPGTTHASTARFTPPAAAPTTRPANAGQRQPVGSRAPRTAASISHGSAA